MSESITADKILNKSQLDRFLKGLTNARNAALALDPKALKASTRRTVLDYYFFQVICNTGLRVSEACRLEVSELSDDYLIIPIHKSKNGKHNHVLFGNRTRKLLDELLAFRAPFVKADSPYLFGLNGKPPGRSWMHDLFKRYLAQFGLPTHFSIHCLRHTYATRCLSEGLDLKFVQSNLRHENLATTSKYLHLTDEARAKVKSLF